MKVQISSSDLNLHYTTRTLLRRMLSPLCGLDRSINFFMRGPLERRVMTAGAELTGVHVLLNQARPGRDPYHIGGSGVVLDEVLIRALGETIERYSQFASAVSNHHLITSASYNELIARGERVVSADKLHFFSSEQCSQQDFPFHPFRHDSPLGWVRAPSLFDDSAMYVPAQLVLLGYTPKHQNNEERLSLSVTTGSAAHTRVEDAFRNALLELIQIDSAMGHWYSSARASRIILDERTEALERLIVRFFDHRSPMPKFYWLPNPDLVGMSIACVLEEDPGHVPAVAVGLGIDLKLGDAMYKALLEAAGVAQLAKLILFYEILEAESEASNGIPPRHILDLDRNVAFYALPENSSLIHAKFDDHSTVRASALPPDSTLNKRAEIRLLVDSFRETNKDLVYLNLTTSDIRDLGFTSVRVWSPDTISLPLPSLPPVCHPRFKAFGGVDHGNPHPYP